MSALRLPTLPALFALALSALLLGTLPTAPATAAEDFSPAEKALFLTDQLGKLKPPATLQFSYRRSGSLEPGFDDSVSIALQGKPGGGCCQASADFLHGERALKLPEIESAEGNPAILYFLERDIREMQRLTKGQANYFRKRIRMAVYQGAELRPVQLAWQGRQVDGQEIVIRPYLDDPLRARFENLATKQYVFTLSDAVPGGVFSIRTRVPGAGDGAAPLLLEEMQLLSLDRGTARAPRPASPPARQP